MPLFDGPIPSFQTERLLLRAMTLEDAPAVQKQFERFEVVQYLGAIVPWPYPPDGAEFYLGQVLLPSMEAGRQRAWGIVLEGQLIGSVTFNAEGDEHRGFWLTPEFWGKGLMSEACNRLTDYVMGELQWPELITGNALVNVASGRIKQRQGFERVESFEKDFVGGRMLYERWRLTQQAWRENS